MDTKIIVFITIFKSFPKDSNGYLTYVIFCLLIFILGIEIISINCALELNIIRLYYIQVLRYFIAKKTKWTNILSSCPFYSKSIMEEIFFSYI